MRLEALEREAQRLGTRLPPMPRIGVLGSTSFWHPRSASVCQQLGAHLAGLGNIVLLTGGMSGVGSTVGSAFHEAQRERQLGGEVVHILPVGHAAPKFGTTQFAGSSLSHRREVLARLAFAYIIVEGGPGTAEEAAIATARGSLVIPIGSLGGVAATLFAAERSPPAFAADHWPVLGSATALPSEVAQAVAAIVREALSRSNG